MLLMGLHRGDPISKCLAMRLQNENVERCIETQRSEEIVDENLRVSKNQSF